MKKVLISAFIGSANLGDQAIFSAITQQLEKDKDIAVAAFTLDRKKHRDQRTIRLIQSNNPFRIMYEIYRCDLLVIGGGGIIQDETSIYNLLRHTYKAFIAMCFGRRYMFYAVGVSELRSVVNRFFARTILQKATAITVRDTMSKVNVRTLGLHKEVIVTADPVMRLVSRHVSTQADSCRPYVVVCLRHWFEINRYLPVAVVRKLSIRSVADQRKYRSFIKNTASFFDWVVRRYNYKIIFLPMFDLRDHRVHEDVLDQMKQRNSGINIRRQRSLDETISFITNAEFVIGMRLHCIIFAAQQHIPFIALNYAQKVDSFLKELSLEKYGIDMVHVTIQKLKYRFERMYAHRKEIQSILKKKTQLLQERERKNNQILRKILFS